MTLLAGKKALIFGVANDHSIAWGIAKALHEHGCEVGFSSIEMMLEKRVRPLAESLGSRFVEPCDVQSDEQIARVFQRWGDQFGQLDILVHALAFAKKEDLEGKFVDTSREGFALALDISAYSLVAISRPAAKLMPTGGSIMTLSYYGAEKVVANYNVMGVAKAALEASVRYLANDLGPQNVRVNAISAGPIRTLAASGVANFKKMYGMFPDITPLRRNMTLEDVAGTAVYLASDLSSGVTGETVYVDGGFNVLGVPTPESVSEPPSATIEPDPGPLSESRQADPEFDPHDGTRLPALGPHGEGWLVLQFIFLGAVFIAGLFVGAHWSGAPRFAASVAGGALILAGVALAYLGIKDLDRSLSPLPRPRETAVLIQDGVYRRLRHPIYAALMLLALGWGLLTASWLAIALALALALLLDLKARREEVWLRERYPGYIRYAAHTKRFVPGVY